MHYALCTVHCGLLVHCGLSVHCGPPHHQLLPFQESFSSLSLSVQRAALPNTNAAAASVCT